MRLFGQLGVLLCGGLVLALSCAPVDHPGAIDANADPMENDAGTGGEASQGTSTAGAGEEGGAGNQGTVDLEICEAELPTGFCFVATERDVTTRVSVSGLQDLVALRSYFHGGLTGRAEIAAEQGSWTFDFAPPTLGFFVPGDYEMLQDAEDPATISIAGDAASCDDEGSFQVTELGWDAWGNLTRFAATFEQRCPRQEGVLRGAINFNANGEPDVPPEDPSDCDVPTPLGLCWVFQGGNTVQREELGPASVTADDGDIQAWMTAGGLQMLVMSPDTLTTFLVIIDAPEGETLAVGKYESTSELDPAAPYLSSPCEQASGAFDVLAFELDEAVLIEGYPQVVRADVDFNVQCGDRPARAFAKFRYTLPE